MLKIGSQVRAIGVTKGNPIFEEAKVVNISSAYITVQVPSGQQWNIAHGDYMPAMSQQERSMLGQFLTEEGKELLAEEYIDIQLNITPKMTQGLQETAVKVFLEENSKKKKKKSTK